MSVGAASDCLACRAADVSQSASIQKVVSTTVGRWGNIDVLFSNAGNFGVVAPVTEYPEDVFDSVLAVHVRGAFLAAKHAQVGLMRVLAKEAAARNIRVNTIHPGPVDNGFQSYVEQNLSPVLGRDATAFFNEIVPLRRHARAEEIARSVLYLASDASSFTTRSRLMVDGG